VGVRDEHWCSDCRRDLDKAKDKYVEAEFPNDKSPYRSNRVFLCKRCAMKSKIAIGGKKVSVWVLFRRLRHRGNPNFEIGVSCFSASVCGNYTPRKTRVNCANIAVTPEGCVYCKRNHPGFTTLPQEKAVAEQSRFQAILKYVKKLGGFIGTTRLENILRMYGLHPDNAQIPAPAGPLGREKV
jgi:hypothetical protein